MNLTDSAFYKVIINHLDQLLVFRDMFLTYAVSENAVNIEGYKKILVNYGNNSLSYQGKGSKSRANFFTTFHFGKSITKFRMDIFSTKSVFIKYLRIRLHYAFEKKFIRKLYFFIEKGYKRFHSPVYPFPVYP